MGFACYYILTFPEFQPVYLVLGLFKRIIYPIPTQYEPPTALVYGLAYMRGNQFYDLTRQTRIQVLNGQFSLVVAGPQSQQEFFEWISLSNNNAYSGSDIDGFSLIYHSPTNRFQPIAESAKIGPGLWLISANCDYVDPLVAISSWWLATFPNSERIATPHSHFVLSSTANKPLEILLSLRHTFIFVKVDNQRLVKQRMPVQSVAKLHVFEPNLVDLENLRVNLVGAS